MTDTEQVSELKRRLLARDKTIAALMSRVQAATDGGPSSFSVLEQNIKLEELVAQKTGQLAAQRAELESALRELRQAQAQLLHAQKLEAIGQLAAGIAHEINTPAQYVSDNTAFLDKAFARIVQVLEVYQRVADQLRTTDDGAAVLGELDALVASAKLPFLVKQAPRAIQQSVEGLERISSIVKAMKEFSHPSAGKKEPVDLAQSIATTLTVARNEWKYVADVRTEFEPNLPVVPALRDELNQVILNLVVNAAHAIAEANGSSTDKGVITVGARLLEPDTVQIWVADTGCGIKPAHRTRIFEPFFTTKPVGKGTGQGLAIAYSVVVEKHHGKIFFESTEGEGTTFYVHLPVEPAATETGAFP